MSESESDAFGDFCDALQEKYNIDHEDREKLIDLYNDQDGLMSKRAAQCASATTTIKVLQKLHSQVDSMFSQEVREKIGEATPEDETRPDMAAAIKGAKAIRVVVLECIQSMIMSVVAGMEGPGL